MFEAGLFVLEGALPTGHVPDFKTAGAADECNLAFELKLLAMFIRQDEAALLVGRTALCPGMHLALEFADLNGGSSLDHGRVGDQAVELLGCHDEETIESRFGHEEEWRGPARAPPIGRNSDPIFFVELVTKLSGEGMLR